MAQFLIGGLLGLVAGVVGYWQLAIRGIVRPYAPSTETVAAWQRVRQV